MVTHEHEQVYKPVDKEVHQEHHHTVVQPVKDREVLPEQHTQVQEGTKTKIISNAESKEDTAARLEAEAAKLGVDHDTTEVGATKHTKSAAPTKEAEHVHHHVHEHVQPVVEKTTVQPHVIHKVKPVHEIHQKETVHHEATTLPPVTMEELKKQGGDVAAATAEDGYRAPTTRRTVRDGTPGFDNTTTDATVQTEEEESPSLLSKITPKTFLP